MNRVISDTAEYGCYLFSQKSVPLLKDFMSKIETDVIGAGLTSDSNGADNQQLDTINRKIQDHPVEKIGVILRDYMTKNRN